MQKILFTASVLFMLASCKNEDSKFDASGTFEATEIIVSSEATGQILKLNIDEGQQLDANQTVGFVDSTQLYLKKLQLQAQIKSILSKEPDANAQLAAVQEQIKTANREQQRTQNLINAGAATQKQLDDINAQIAVLQKQLEAQQSTLNITTRGLNSDVAPLTVQIAEINDQLNKSQIINPIKGTVLTQYAEPDEITSTGKPIYKIADLSEMILRAYVTGDQLSKIKIGQTVKVFVDNGAKDYKQMQGTITWISDKSEFTPKTIQTKDERANLVYAVKIKVPNDGTIKIGMYGEVNF